MGNSLSCWPRSHGRRTSDDKRRRASKSARQSAPRKDTDFFTHADEITYFTDIENGRTSILLGRHRHMDPLRSNPVQPPMPPSPTEKGQVVRVLPVPNSEENAWKRAGMVITFDDDDEGESSWAGSTRRGTQVDVDVADEIVEAAQLEAGDGGETTSTAVQTEALPVDPGALENGTSP
ncbi:hypothetical protein V2A60_008171 [Cordyceps javanica]